jgi:hypothetical protein
MHSIRTDFGFNLLHRASKLKTGIIEKVWWLLLVFRICEFSFPQYFCCFFYAVNRDGDIVRESFSVKFMLHSLWYTSVIYVFPMWSSVFVLCWFFSQPYVNITWITGHIHRSIVDNIYPTCEYVEMAKKKIPYQLHWVAYFCEMWSKEFIYRAFNWSVKILLMNRDEDPPF